MIVHRDLQADAAHPSGASYHDVTTFGPGQTVSPLAAPHSPGAVNDLLL